MSRALDASQLLLERYNHTEFNIGHWTPVAANYLQPFSAGAVLGGMLYLCGGGRVGADWEASKSVPSRRVAQASLLTSPMTFKPAACMQIGRILSAAVCLRGQLFVIGGIGQGGSVLSSVESFSPESGRWQLLAELNVARAGCCAVVCGDQIYVIGGY